ncbi:MAG: hypothetical protein WC199_10795 [Dysgonamonadaceae bacterium]
MKIETDDQPTEHRTVTSSIYTKLEDIGDTLTHPKKLDFTPIIQRISSLSIPKRQNTRVVKTNISVIFNHLFLRALWNRQWSHCINYALAHLYLKDGISKNNLIARALTTADEDTDTKRINGILGMGIGVMVITLILSLIYAFFTDMIVSVMMLFGIYGFIIMLFGFAILVVIIGIYFATR